MASDEKSFLVDKQQKPSQRQILLSRHVLEQMFMWDRGTEQINNNKFRDEIPSVYVPSIADYWTSDKLPNEWKEIKDMLFKHMDYYPVNIVNSMKFDDNGLYSWDSKYNHYFSLYIDNVLKIFEKNIAPTFNKRPKTQNDTILLISIANLYYLKGLQLYDSAGNNGKFIEDVIKSAIHVLSKSLKYYNLSKSWLLLSRCKLFVTEFTSGAVPLKVKQEIDKHLIRIDYRMEKDIYSQSQFDCIVTQDKKKIMHRIRERETRQKTTENDEWCILL